MESSQVNQQGFEFSNVTVTHMMRHVNIYLNVLMHQGFTTDEIFCSTTASTIAAKCRNGAYSTLFCVETPIDSIIDHFTTLRWDILKRFGAIVVTFL